MLICSKEQNILSVKFIIVCLPAHSIKLYLIKGAFGSQISQQNKKNGNIFSVITEIVFSHKLVLRQQGFFWALIHWAHDEHANHLFEESFSFVIKKPNHNLVAIYLLVHSWGWFFLVKRINSLTLRRMCRLVQKYHHMKVEMSLCLDSRCTSVGNQV